MKKVDYCFFCTKCGTGNVLTKKGEKYIEDLFVFRCFNCDHLNIIPDDFRYYVKATRGEDHV